LKQKPGTVIIGKLEDRKKAITGDMAHRNTNTSTGSYFMYDRKLHQQKTDGGEKFSEL
jgi:hypothetical protein